MSAPLKGYLRNLSTERIGVKVRRIKNTYTFELCTDDGVLLLPPGTPVIYNEKPIRVICKEKEVPAAGTFVITAETIDPFHVILDMFQ